MKKAMVEHNLTGKPIETHYTDVVDCEVLDCGALLIYCNTENGVRTVGLNAWNYFIFEEERE